MLCLRVEEVCEAVILDEERVDIREEQNAKILQALNELWKDGKTYGDTKYNEFFTKQGGKKSQSDWYYRMNNKIKKEMELRK